MSRDMGSCKAASCDFSGDQVTEVIEFILKKNGPHLCNNEAVLSKKRRQREGVYIKVTAVYNILYLCREQMNSLNRQGNCASNLPN